jgi:inner membrane transporter RhtA
MWAFYILGARRAGREFEGLSGLALAMAVGSVAVVPFAAATTGAVLIAPHVLAIGLGIALLSSAIPYALELLALRRVPASTFSVLLAFAPVVAALAGWLVLGQALTLVQWTGVLLVVAACIGAIRMTTRSSGAGPR